MPYLRRILTSTDPEGWAGCAAAIGGCDFYTTTASLRLPVLAIAGAHDGTTPPDLVHRFALMQRAGHLPMVERPAEYAALLRDFLTGIGHI
jgi:3-oxoadipate enol-lactonase